MEEFNGIKLRLSAEIEDQFTNSLVEDSCPPLDTGVLSDMLDSLASGDLNSKSALLKTFHFY